MRLKPKVRPSRFYFAGARSPKLMKVVNYETNYERPSNVNDEYAYNIKAA